MRHNPHGPAGCGFVLYEMDQYCNDGKGDLIDHGQHYLGYNISNNQAEYQGLIDGLECIADNYSCDGLYIRGDSEIVINQVKGVYAVRSPNIIPYYNDLMCELGNLEIEFYSAQHIPRHENCEADELANRAIDE